MTTDLKRDRVMEHTGNAVAEAAPQGRRLLYSGFKWDHHDEDFGYHHIAWPPRDYVDGAELWGGDAPIGSLRRRVNFLLIDMVTIARAWSYDGVLVFYPEQTAYLSAPILRLMGKRVVYALHLREDFWIERNDSLFLKLKRFNLRFVNRFVVLTNQQRAAFCARFPGKVRTVPHGAACSGEVLLSSGPRAHCSIAGVGENGRDYALLKQIIETFSREFPEIRFDLVGMKYDNLGALRFRPNVVCHPRLDRDAYRRVLGESLFMLLPLTFATANNALLEGLSIGLPVICNRVDGVLDYLPDGDYTFDGIEQLHDMVRRRLALGDDERMDEARHLVAYVRQRYAWSCIRRQVVECCFDQ
jgi:glycosyltransferase involved in cell wall biosynthesis